MGLPRFHIQGHIYYITTVVYNRLPLFTRPSFIIPLFDSLNFYRHKQKFKLLAYVIMPDHIHLFCSPGIHDFPPVRKWAAFWKSRSASTWPFPEDAKVWQRDVWDTQLRRSENYGAKWSYVQTNPVRANLTGRAEDWPYQGELNTLRWHDR